MRKQQLTRNSASYVGQRKSSVRGGGGPENAGARTTTQAGISFIQQQPSWAWEDDSYMGFAARSTTPNVAGIPANNFRTLGDVHGGRG